MDMALPNPSGNLCRVSLIALRFFSLFRNPEGCIRPIDRGNISFILCIHIVLVVLICRCVHFMCFVNSTAFIGY